MDYESKLEFISRVEHFKGLKSTVTKECPYIVYNDEKISIIGAYIISNNVPTFLKGFQLYMQNSFSNYAKNQASSITINEKTGAELTKISVTKKGIAKLNSNVLEVSLMVSKYIDINSQKTVGEYIEFIAPF